MALMKLFLCAELALSIAPGAAAAADPAAKAAALAKCQGACNKLDTKSGSFPQMKAHCRNPARGYAPTDKSRIESCIKGFKLGLSIGCDFVCEAGGAPKAGTSSGAALLASVRAARDAACKGHAGQDSGATAACTDGFDQGSSTYFDTPSLWVGIAGGGGVLWPLFKFFGVLALLYRGATDPRVKHALPLPAQQSVHRIEKAVQPWLRKAGKVAALLFGEARKAVAAQLDARAAQQAAAKASGLPGGLKPFGTLTFGDADLAGGDGGSGGTMMPESADFPAPLSFDAAKAFCRAFTANDGSLRLLTAAEAAAVADPAPLRSRTLVTGGYSKTVCEEALRELATETLPPLLAAAGADSYPKAAHAALAKCLTPNMLAKLLREAGLLAAMAAGPADADARDAELLSAGHASGVCHVVCLGRMKGKPSLHVVTTAFVGGDKRHRAKLVTSNLLQSYAPGVVCKVNYAVRKTGYRSGAQAAGECATELRAAVERGAWGEFLSADGEGGHKNAGAEGDKAKADGV